MGGLVRQRLDQSLRGRPSNGEIVADALGLGDHLEELSALAPGNSVSDLWSSLAPYRDHEHLLLVGHEPVLSA